MGFMAAVLGGLALGGLSSAMKGGGASSGGGGGGFDFVDEGFDMPQIELPKPFQSFDRSSGANFGGLGQGGGGRRQSFADNAGISMPKPFKGLPNQSPFGEGQSAHPLLKPTLGRESIYKSSHPLLNPSPGAFNNFGKDLEMKDQYKPENRLAGGATASPIMSGVNFENIYKQSEQQKAEAPKDLRSYIQPVNLGGSNSIDDVAPQPRQELPSSIPRAPQIGQPSTLGPSSISQAQAPTASPTQSLDSYVPLAPNMPQPLPGPQAEAPIAAASGKLSNVYNNIGNKYNINPRLMQRVAQIESNENPRARAPASMSSAGGLYQFTNPTWRDYQGRVQEAGYSGDRFNPQSSAAGAAIYMNDNRRYLEKSLGRDVEDYELYIAHNLGPGGARKLLGSDRDTPINNVLSRKVRQNNPAFFRGARTAGDAIDRYKSKLGF